MNGKRIVVSLMVLVSVVFALTILFTQTDRTGGAEGDGISKPSKRSRKPLRKNPKINRNQPTGEVEEIDGPSDAPHLKTAATKEELLKRLASTLPRLQFSDIMFSDTISYFRQVGGLNIYVDWETLKSSNIEKNRLIQADLSDITLETAIKTVLSSAGGRRTQLKYIIVNNILKISTKRGFDSPQRATSVIYDVRNLLTSVPNFTAPFTPSMNAGRYETTGGGTDDACLFSASEDAASGADDRIQQLVELITGNVDPGSWQPTGIIGSIDVIRGQLVITQLPENQEEIRNLLDRLQESLQNNLLVRARWIEADQSQVNKIFAESQKKKQVPPHISDDDIKRIGARTVYQGQLSFTNGQRIYLTSGPGEYFVTGIEPVVSAQIASNRPIIGSAQWGPILDLEASLDRHKESATVTLSNVVSTKTGEKKISTASFIKTARTKTTAAGVVISSGAEQMQLPQFDTQHFATTVQIPLAQPCIVGGMTTPKQKEGKILYLIIEITTDK